MIGRQPCATCLAFTFAKVVDRSGMLCLTARVSSRSKTSLPDAGCLAHLEVLVLSKAKHAMLTLQSLQL